MILLFSLPSTSYSQIAKNHMFTYSYLRLMKVSERKFLRTVRINSDAKLCDLLESLDTVMMSIVLHRQRQHAPVMIIHFVFSHIKF